MNSSISLQIQQVADSINILHQQRNTTNDLNELISTTSADQLLSLGVSNTSALTHAMLRYIDSLPDYLSAFQQLTIDAAIDEYSDPFLSTAVVCFLENHDLTQDVNDTCAALYKAYLTHRMLEELNDRIRTERGHPLAPTDQTHINLIVHTLIGEKNANLLDQIVLVRLEIINVTQTPEAKKIFSLDDIQKRLRILQKAGWKPMVEKFPVLIEDLTEEL